MGSLRTRAGCVCSRSWRPRQSRSPRATAAHGSAAAQVEAECGSAAVPWADGSSSLGQDLIDTQEAARMLGCKPRNVRDLRKRGVLRSGRLVGDRWLIERVEVLAEVHRRAEARGL